MGNIYLTEIECLFFEEVALLIVIAMVMKIKMIKIVIILV